MTSTEKIGLITIFVALIWAVAYMAASVISEPTCLSAGYPKTSVTWNLSVFCVKRLDQTDIVVPIGNVRQ